MEAIIAGKLFSKSKQEIKDWFDDRLGKSITIRLKKTPEPKTMVLAAQDVFSMSKKQSYAMYMNYLACLKRDAPMIHVMSTDITPKNVFIIYGYDASNPTKGSLVISENQISKNKEILVIDRKY